MLQYTFFKQPSVFSTSCIDCILYFIFLYLCCILGWNYYVLFILLTFPIGPHNAKYAWPWPIYWSRKCHCYTIVYVHHTSVLCCNPLLCFTCLSPGITYSIIFSQGKYVNFFLKIRNTYILNSVFCLLIVFPTSL